jgi:hypothetical protein
VGGLFSLLIKKEEEVGDPINEKMIGSSIIDQNKLKQC